MTYEQIAAVAGKPSVYEIGNAMFRDLRAFLDAAGIDPSLCGITITLPSPVDRSLLVGALQQSAPPSPTMSRWSSAQAVNYGGTWQGVEYLFAVRDHLEKESRS